VAAAASISLLCTLLAALLVRLLDEIQMQAVAPSRRTDERMFSTEGVFALTLLILVVNFGLIGVAGTFIVQEARGLAVLRLVANGHTPTLSLVKDKTWHLFISYNWANQDAAATIKRQLQLLLPGVSVFLDVDELDSSNETGRYVAASQAMLVMLASEGYLSSPNCIREVEAAKQLSLPLVRVHDADPQKNGSPLASLRRAATQRLSRRDAEYVFDDGEVIPWHRAANFQTLCLALIAEQMLLASPLYVGRGALPLYVKGALAWAQPTFAEEVPLYVSAHDNAQALEVARELTELFPAVKVIDTRSGTRHWMLFASPTYFQGECGERLAADVAAGLAAGMRFVVLYAPETASFADCIVSTPAELLRQGLYGPTAIEWRAGPLHSVSTRQTAMALGASASQSRMPVPQIPLGYAEITQACWAGSFTGGGT